jgi:hypothetical protein
MTKGHNKGHVKDRQPKAKHQVKEIKPSKKESAETGGRNQEKDQAGGKKGANSI